MIKLPPPVLGINQPYFFPYLGYFSLIEACDHFIIYDDVKFSKRGWINRNQILRGGELTNVTVALRAGSDSLKIAERKISADFDWRKLLRILEGAYREAPFWGELRDYLPKIVEPQSDNLFEFLDQTIREICALLNINTPILRSSTVLPAGFEGTGIKRIFAATEALGSRSYLNLPGGRSLYSFEEFHARGLELGFLEHLPVRYPQVGSSRLGVFHERLSVLDMLANIGGELTSKRVRDDFFLAPSNSTKT